MKAVLYFTFLILINITVSAQIFTRVISGNIVTDASSSFGSSWADYDNDGNLDMFVANVYSENNDLYQNNGNGTFTKITTGPVISDGKFTEGSSWADYDNDGDIDLFITNATGQTNNLYQNNGNGTFTQVTIGAIVNDAGKSSIGSAWGDYDNDGFVDLFVANYGSNNYLYHNNGNGSFTKITTGLIVTDVVAGSVGCSWADYDNDGFLDLFVANLAPGNDYLYKNNGNGTFAKVTSGPIVNDGAESVGGSWGDYDNDGDLDLFVTTGITNTPQNNRLYNNNGNGTFSQITSGLIVNDGGISCGAAWGDYDNDGYLDLFVANTSAMGSGMNNFLYHNNGNGTFTKITTGNIVSDGQDSRGCSWGDYDNDGDIDLHVSNEINQQNFLYRNDGNANSWINIKLEGIISNKSAIGAKVKVKAIINGNALWQYHEVSSQTGYVSQNSLNVEYGLGNATLIDSLIIKWPSGLICYFTNVPVNQFMTITESCAYPTADFSISNDTICQNDSINLIDISTNNPNAWNWTFPGGTPSTSSSKNPRVKYSLPGLYNITLIATNDAGSDTITKVNYITVHSLPTVYVGIDDTIFKGMSVQLIASGAEQYIWSPTIFLTDPSIFNPVATPEASITYIVKGTDSFGCVNSDTIEIKVISSGFFIPTAFTPNGDGENDVLFVRGDITDLEFTVFNRWGEQVFYSNNILVGWDGKKKDSGEALQQGAYVYFVKAKVKSGEEVNKKGIVNLIR